MFINVDLPEPLAPMRARNSPFMMLSDTPRTACTGTSPESYILWSSSIWTTGAMSGNSGQKGGGRRGTIRANLAATGTATTAAAEPTGAAAALLLERISRASSAWSLEHRCSAWHGDRFNQRLTLG